MASGDQRRRLAGWVVSSSGYAFPQLVRRVALSPICPSPGAVVGPAGTNSHRSEGFFPSQRHGAPFSHLRSPRRNLVGNDHRRVCRCLGPPPPDVFACPFGGNLALRPSQRPARISSKGSANGEPLPGGHRARTASQPSASPGLERGPNYLSRPLGPNPSLLPVELYGHGRSLASPALRFPGHRSNQGPVSQSQPGLVRLG